MVPTWVIFVAIGIIISGFMAVRAGKQERKLENEMIEKEGEVYIKRMEMEKERKALKSYEG